MKLFKGNIGPISKNLTGNLANSTVVRKKLRTKRRPGWDTGATLVNTGKTLVKHWWNILLRMLQSKNKTTHGRTKDALIDIVTSWAAHCSWEHRKDIDQPKVGQGPRSITKLGLLNHHQFFGANIFKIKEFFRHKDFFDQNFVSKLFWY